MRTIKISARRLAVDLLLHIEAEKAYANLLLQGNLQRLTDPRDRQLATMLVNGVMKHRLTLDYTMRLHLRTSVSALPHEVREILRVGIFQILYLDKIPPSAAVNEAVEMAKERQARFAPVVNGVLRQVVRAGGEISWPDRQKEPVRYLSVRYSHPEWMVRRWWKRFGFAETEELCRANNEPAQVWIRTNALKISRPELMERLKAENVETVAGDRVRDGLKIIGGAGALEQLDAFKQGLFTVQDESSQLVAPVLAPQPGQQVLDACSAPGGKTSHLAQLMADQGKIWAFDVHPHKLELIAGLAERLGIHNIATRLGDARELTDIPDFSMDKVLVDAPCSGLGVLRRKSDLRWHKEEKSLLELPGLQGEILERAARTVKPGGELVYSTCTLEPEENFEVVKAFRQTHPKFKPVSLSETLAPFLLDEKDRGQAEKGMLQLFPHKHKTDGFFLAKFYRMEV